LPAKEKLKILMADIDLLDIRIRKGSCEPGVKAIFLFAPRNGCFALAEVLCYFDLTASGQTRNRLPRLEGSAVYKGAWPVEFQMRVAGFLLLLAGWILVLAAVALLSTTGQRAAFLTAGLGVELLGFVLVARSHLTPKRDEA
jgi:hypothetical protein